MVSLPDVVQLLGATFFLLGGTTDIVDHSDDVQDVPVPGTPIILLIVGQILDAPYCETDDT